MPYVGEVVWYGRIITPQGGGPQELVQSAAVVTHVYPVSPEDRVDLVSWFTDQTDFLVNVAHSVVLEGGKWTEIPF